MFENFKIYFLLFFITYTKKLVKMADLLWYFNKINTVHANKTMYLCILEKI